MGLVKRYQLAILFIICVLGLVLRLYKISNPIADWHSWRQADTSAVTRNFVKHGINLLYPQYDDFSDVSGTGKFNPHGYRFVEFPIFNLIHFTFYKVFPFGTLEEWGRFTSIVAAITSGISLFFLARRRLGLATGFLSALFYLILPYNMYFTRVVLPDPLMVALFLITLNMYDLYNSKKTVRYLILTCIFGGLAAIVKPVGLFFLLPITLIQIKKYGRNFWKAREFIICHLAFVLPFGIWRAWSFNHPEGVPPSAWLLNGNKIRFKGAFFQWIFGARIGILILGKWGVWPFMTGLISAGSYAQAMALSAVLYLFTFATGNVQHDYYQIPIIPAISLLLAIGTVKLWHGENSFVHTLMKRGLLIISLGFMLAFSWYDIRGLYQINNWSIVAAGQEVDRLAPSDAVVIAPYQGDTAFLYQTNRQGFAYLYKPLKDMIDTYHAKYYVSVNYDDDTNEIMNKYTIIVKKPEYVIVKLEEKLQPVPTP